MPRKVKVKSGSLVSTAVTVAPIVYDLIKYAYTRMRQAEQAKQTKPPTPVASDSAPKTTKQGESA